MAKQQGLTDRHIAELATHPRPPDLYTPQELAALDLAEALWADAGGARADAQLTARLREHFSSGALLELTWAIGQYIGLGKMVAFFGLERAE